MPPNFGVTKLILTLPRYLCGIGGPVRPVVEDSHHLYEEQDPDPHHFNADLDPAFHIKADPDLASKKNADPDPNPGGVC